jgi:GMC oxidoreductase
MFDTASASNGVKLALLEGQLLNQEIDRATFLPGDLEGEALDNLIRDGAMSMHHPTCTAKMGQDDLSVVDAQLRVYDHADHHHGQHPCAVRDYRRALGRNPQRLILPIREAPPGNDDVSRLPRRRSSQ